jgi:uncharacterized membrane protein
VSRRRYIDWARGIAVLIMIEAHVLDSWTLRSERGSTAFGLLNLLGGFAAPLFLWLAGLALVLSAERALVRNPDRGEAASGVLRRGVEILLLAFLFRLQAYIVSPGNPPVSLLRVDILNIMGPAMVGAALLWRFAPNAHAAAAICGGAAVLLALVTPVARAASWLPMLPSPLQWYISPNGNHSTFTLFPWAGFVFAGAAYGALLADAGGHERKAVAQLGIAGALVIAACYYASTLPSVYAASSFWTTSPTYFGIRTGVMMLGLWTLLGLTPLAVRVSSVFGVLEWFGRHSLFVYWIHVELVYGYATMMVHHRLPLWGTAIGYVVFCSAMYWAIALKERVVLWRRSRPRHASTPQTLRA